MRIDQNSEEVSRVKRVTVDGKALVTALVVTLDTDEGWVDIAIPRILKKLPESGAVELLQDESVDIDIKRLTGTVKVLWHE